MRLRARPRLLPHLAVLLLGWFVSSCAHPTYAAGPGIWAIVDAEPELAAQLDRIELSTDHDGSTVWLTEPPAGERRGSIPIVHDLPWQAGRYRDTLRLRGYRGTTVLVERSADLHFSADKRLVLHVLLSRACAEQVGVCEQAGETCVDCGPSCASDRIDESALRSLDFGVNPLAGYRRLDCSAPIGAADAGPSSATDAGTTEPGQDAGSQGQLDASQGGGPSDAQVSSSDARSDTLDASPATDAVVSSADGATDASQEAATTPDAMASPLLQECALLMHLDEARWSGSPGEVRDLSGQGNHGTAIGTAQTTTSGRFSAAARLDGAGWIKVPDAPSLRPSNALTVSAWFYLDQAPNNWPGIVAKRVGYNDSCSFGLFLAPDSKIYVDVVDDDNRFASNTVVTPAQWHHVAFTYDGNAAMAERVRLYIDGALDRSAPETSANIPPFTGDVILGNLINGADTLVGRIDEVGIWTRALSVAEIATLATQPLK